MDRQKAIEEIRDTVRYILTIANSDLEWETKFDLIFSEIASRQLAFQLAPFNLEVNWNDPDTSYQDDVEAYIYGLESHLIPALDVMERAVQ